MFSGSIVVKRTELLNMIENMKIMMRSKASDNAKRVVWGQQIGYETLLEEDISRYEWDAFINEFVWANSWTAGVKPYELFAWLEGE